MPIHSSPSHRPFTIACVVGARPNFMKIAPIMAAFNELGPDFQVKLVHTGQHYDAAMNHQYFEALGIPQPDINLEVGSGSHGQQTAEIMRRFEPALEELRASAVLVVGDVNSTIACALVAAKMQVPVIHVEAGLRSFDRSMPEEINRVLTDQISDLLFTTERSGRDNLLREGIDGSRIHFVGNVMIDTLRRNLDRAVSVTETLKRFDKTQSVDNKGYVVLTMHRPSNVDNPDTLRALLGTVAEIAATTPVIFPVHPRTGGMIEKFGLQKMIDILRLVQLPPMGYLEMLGLMKDARAVLTDSGGIQEETTALGVPCITLRNNTERNITVDEGTSTLVGQDPEKILATYRDVLRTGGKTGRIPEFWDGQASTRIAAAVKSWAESACKA